MKPRYDIAIVLSMFLACVTALVITHFIPWQWLAGSVVGVALWIARSPFAPALETLVAQAVNAELARLSTSMTPGDAQAAFSAATVAGKVLVPPPLPTAAKIPEVSK
jgi:hypothetical protein